MAGRSLLERWRHHVRRQCDAGSASIASYVVAIALFTIGTSYLMHFVVEPPGTSNFDHADLRTKADDALAVLLGTPGSPNDWGATRGSVDNDLLRLGLIEQGTTIRLDPAKFDALARGKFATWSSENGGVDYKEAKTMLGLTGYEFHLSAFPNLVTDASDPYGMDGFEDYRVAYLGHFLAGASQAETTAERAAIMELDLDMVDTTRASDLLGATGDIYMDTANDVAANLLPQLGTTLHSTVIGPGVAPATDFTSVRASVYGGLVPANITGVTDAIAMTTDGATLGYAKARELRVIVGKADLTGATAARLDWWEWVDTDRGNLSYDCGDYGYAEVSPDAGATWYQLTDSDGKRSTDCSQLLPMPLTPQAPIMTRREVGDLMTTCVPCGNAPEVLVAFHWIADNDDLTGYGWVIDDVKLESTGPLGNVHYMRKTFREPAYDLLIVGSAIDNAALASSTAREAIRDFVDVHGGRLLVTGPTSDVQWLDDLVDASTAPTSSPTLLVEDTVHPILTVPNAISYADHTRARNWEIGQGLGLFTPVLAERSDSHLLSVSREGAWGNGASVESAVILSAFRPSALGLEEGARFFANAITSHRYHYLYMEVGPAIPEHEAIASASRNSIMNKMRDGSSAYGDVTFVLHVWSGTTTADPTPDVVPGIAPSPPRSLSLTMSDNSVTLSWLAPETDGSDTPTTFHVYGGNAPGSATLVQNVPYAGAGTAYSLLIPGLTYGKTYYYEVSADNGAESRRSAAVNATPIATLAAPAAPTFGLPSATSVNVQWVEPSGGGTIYGYILSVNDSPPSTGYHILATLDRVTSYVHSVSDSAPRTYTLAALNARGWSPNSTASAEGRAVIPVGPPTLLVGQDGAKNLSLTWVAPSDLLGQTPTGYLIQWSATAGGSYTTLTTLTDPLAVSYVDRDLAPSTTRYYKVSAITDVTTGIASASAGATTKALPAAPVMTGTKVLSIVTLAWTIPASEAPIVRYDIYRGSQNDVNTMTLYASVPTTPTTGLAGGHWYAVRAVSAVGSGAWSNTAFPT